MKRIVLVAMLAGLSLGACGLRGDLERAPPLWGEERARQEEEARQRAERQQAPSAEQTPGIGSNSSSIPVPSR